MTGTEAYIVAAARTPVGRRYAGLVEPPRSGWPCRQDADQPTAARRGLFGASEYGWRAVGKGESVL
jgi:hypothetical protein